MPNDTNPTVEAALASATRKTSPTYRAHAFMARAMARVEPQHRSAVLVELLSSVPNGLAIIHGQQEAAEKLYAAADAFATRAMAGERRG